MKRTIKFYVQFKGVAGQTDMAEYVSLTDQRRMQITLPDADEQRAIVRILGTLDDRIELNQRMNVTLEDIARVLFKSWFLDFDPVRTKVGGSDPNLPQPVADLFPDSFKQSELGEIPATWDMKTAGDIAERIAMGPFGSSIKVETFVESGVPVISGQHLHSFMLSDTTYNFITEEHATRLRKALVQRGDVVFTHAGNIGQVALIPEQSRYARYVISQRQFYMRCDSSQVTPLFVAFYFSSEQGRHRLLANTSSSGVPSIARPVSYLRSIQLPIPPIGILTEFDWQHLYRRPRPCEDSGFWPCCNACTGRKGNRSLQLTDRSPSAKCPGSRWFRRPPGHRNWVSLTLPRPRLSES